MLLPTLLIAQIPTLAETGTCGCHLIKIVFPLNLLISEALLRFSGSSLKIPHPRKPVLKTGFPLEQFCFRVERKQPPLFCTCSTEA